MQLHRNTTEVFINYLKKHNYPDNSIVLEWGTKNCALDIAIVADDLVTPIALFEIKGRKTKETISRGIQQLRKAAQTLEISVPCSLVFDSDTHPFFEVVEITDIVYNDAPIIIEELLSAPPIREFVSYSNINGGAVSKVETQKQERKQKTIDRMKLLCWGLFPIVGIVLIGLDAHGTYVLTPLRLILIGAIAILVLVPFFNEITLKDFSFKRKDK